MNTLFSPRPQRVEDRSWVRQKPVSTSRNLPGTVCKARRGPLSSGNRSVPCRGLLRKQNFALLNLRQEWTTSSRPDLDTSNVRIKYRPITEVRQSKLVNSFIYFRKAFLAFQPVNRLHIVAVDARQWAAILGPCHPCFFD